MSEPKHWIDVFTLETWGEFLDAGGKTSGFPERRWGTVQQIAEGDRLYGYIAGVSRWVAILEAVGLPFRDSTPIWTGADYPSRIGVQVVEALTPETAVPALDLRDRMPLFHDLKNPNKWSIYFRSSPGRLSSEDAQIVEDAILQAKREPVVRPIRIPRGRQRPQVIETPEGVVMIPEEDQPESDELTTNEVGSSHSEIQWQLLKLGSDMGLSVWVARNDRSGEWNGHPFADIPRVIDALPTQFDPATSRTIELIDVLWLDGNAIVAAFEIESTTVVYSGLLRMSDLLAMQPNLSIPLFVVAPDERRDRVIREVNRPTFSRRDTPLADVCRFISFEGLRKYVQDAGDLLRYLRPEVLQEISESCEADEVT
jgi:hypothetical protein